MAWASGGAAVQSHVLYDSDIGPPPGLPCPAPYREEVEALDLARALAVPPRWEASGEDERVWAACWELAPFAEPAFGPAGGADVEHVDQSHACVAATALHGRVDEASRSPRAHHILLSLISTLDAEAVAFIPEELAGQGSRVSKDVYGHLVVCALVQHWPNHEATAALVDEVLAEDVAGLCCHEYGHAVAVEIMAHGLGAQRGLIAAALARDAQRFARHRFAARVFEGALQSCAAPSVAREALVAQMLQNPEELAGLACHRFGTRIVRRLLEQPRVGGLALRALQQAGHRVWQDPIGVKLLQACPGERRHAPRGGVGREDAGTGRRTVRAERLLKFMAAPVGA